MRKHNYIIIFSIFFFISFFSTNEYQCILFSILSQLFQLIYFNKKNIKTVDRLYSPWAIFVFFFFVYSIIGKLLWLLRDIYFENWSGEAREISLIFDLTGLFLLITGSVFLKYYENKQIKKQANKKTNSTFSINIPGTIIFLIIILEYLGAYLMTAGYQLIPILEENMDEARIQLSEISFPGKGIGSIFVFLGFLIQAKCILKIKNSKDIIGKLYFISLFIISYIPFAFYSGRLMIFLPFLVIILIVNYEKLKNNFHFNPVKILLFSLIGIAVFFLFGALRTFGVGEMESTTVFTYFMSDFFPEFRGTVYAHSLTNNDFTLNIFSSMFFNNLPDSVVSLFGINKNEICGIAESIKDLFETNILGIRISLFGELSMGNIFSYIFLLLFISLILNFLTKRFFLSSNGINKLLFMVLGLMMGLCIPYGFEFFNTVFRLIIVGVILVFFTRFRWNTIK